MIPMDDLEQDVRTAMVGSIAEADAAIRRVRDEGREAIDPFIDHLREVVREVDGSMAAAADSMERSGGRVEDAEFQRTYRAGCIHSSMVAYCRALAEDSSEEVRMAGAAGEILLFGIDRSDRAVRVVTAMQARLGSANG